MSLNFFEQQQIAYEIQWLKNKLESVRIKATRKPSAVREMHDLERQIREREVRLAFGKTLEEL